MMLKKNFLSGIFKSLAGILLISSSSVFANLASTTIILSASVPETATVSTDTDTGSMTFVATSNSQHNIIDDRFKFTYWAYAYVTSNVATEITATLTGLESIIPADRTFAQMRFSGVGDVAYNDTLAVPISSNAKLELYAQAYLGDGETLADLPASDYSGTLTITVTAAP